MSTRPTGMPAITALWVLVVITGMGALWQYSIQPGAAAANVPASVPASPSFTLVVTLHPRCACSRATLDELATVMARHADRLHTDVYVSDIATPDPLSGNLARRAAAIPGVTVHFDPGAAQATRLGAKTSGTVFLYDPAGQLRFHGGITPSRGEVGDNAGRATIEQLLSTAAGDASPAPTPITTPVFGCSLK